MVKKFHINVIHLVLRIRNEKLTRKYYKSVFLVAMVFWEIGWVSDSTSTMVSDTLFVLDYLAEMYDPNPDAPGPWFKSHFHRFLGE